MLLFIGGAEIFIVLLVVLLFFGSDKIPEFAKGLGKGIRQFKDVTSGIQDDIQREVNNVKDDMDLPDVKKSFNEAIAVDEPVKVAPKKEVFAKEVEKPDHAVSRGDNPIKAVPVEEKKDDSESTNPKKA